MLFDYLDLDEQNFLKQCQFQAYKASGTGGQKRNKKASGIRITHTPTLITVAICQDRQQNINKIYACRLLRIKISTSINIDTIDESWVFHNHINEKNWNFAPTLQKIFYKLKKHNFHIKETSKNINTTQNKLIKFLSKNKQVWQIFNQERINRNLKAIKTP